MNTIEAIERIEKTAGENRGDVRRIKSMGVGHVVRQGDIYIHGVSEDHPHGKACGRQLAQGTSKGSRHVADGGDCFEGVKAPEWCEIALLGPLVKSPDRFTITHPEHADVCLPAGNYQITHQMDARTLERVRD